MKDPFYLNPKMKNLIGENGDTKEDIKEAEQAALDVGKRLIGATLIVKNQLYIISMVELYYGGIGDNCHDWYRRKLAIEKKKNTTSWQNAEIINSKGLRFNMKNNTHSKRNRIDIVVGNEGVPVSFLLRNLIKDYGKMLVSRKQGGPGVTAGALFSDGVKNNAEIVFNPDKPLRDTFCLYDTQEIFFKRNGLTLQNIEIEGRCINNSFKGLPGEFEGEDDWNLSIFKPEFIIPAEILRLKP